MTPLAPEQYPTWAVIVAVAAALVTTGIVVGAVLYYLYRRRNRRVGTREYQFPRRSRGSRDQGGWGPWMLSVIAFALLAAVGIAGCAERAVIVPPTVPVRLAEQLYSVSVWVKDTTGKEVKARADLFPGMIIATDPNDFPTATRAKFMNLRRDE